MEKQRFIATVKVLIIPADFEQYKKLLDDVPPESHEIVIHGIINGYPIQNLISVLPELEETMKTLCIDSYALFSFLSKYRWIFRKLEHKDTR